jgi:hypothetical protein
VRSWRGAGARGTAEHAHGLAVAATRAAGGGVGTCVGERVVSRRHNRHAVRRLGVTAQATGSEAVMRWCRFGASAE